MSNELLKLLGVGVAVGLGVAIFKGAKEGAVTQGMQQARDALFTVSPGCAEISFKGGTGAPDPEQLELAEKYYFAPFVRHALDNQAAEAEADATGVSLTTFLSATVLYDLFPECRQSLPWPPDSLLTAGNFGLIWVAMNFYMAEVIARVQAGDA